MLRVPLAVGCLLAVAVAVLPAAVLRIDREADGLRLDLGNGAELAFALQGDRLLGLRTARVDGVACSSTETVCSPLLADEFAERPWIATALRLREAVVVDGTVELRCELLGSDRDATFRRWFVYSGDRDAALADLPEDLVPLRDDAEQARTGFAALVDASAAMTDLLAEQRALQEVLSGDDPSVKEHRQARKALTRLEQKELPRLRRRVRAELVASDATARSCQERIASWERALDAHAVAQYGRIHRDHYRFAVTRLPATVCQLAQRQGETEEPLQPVGELTWIIEPVERRIAGWPWRGWSWRYRFALADGRRVNVLRQLGTWELDGEIDGLTAIALRYRGLGRIEQRFSSTGDGGAREAWSTTETLPGAAGAAPAVSPVVPPSTGPMDRGDALRHRVGAWIAKPARGAGAPLLDCQWRPHAVFCSTVDAQDDLRALSECLPGDRHLSQSDEEFFPLTSSHETRARLYLALVDRQQPFTIEERRTRWQELDAEVRRRVADELGFVEFPVLPGVGVLASGQPHNLLAGMDADLLDAWQAQGVRLIASHSPGWVNGEVFRDGQVQARHVNGGECEIYDLRPSPPVAPLWRAFVERCAERGIAYYPWIGMTIARDGPFAARVGSAARHWSLNTPDDQHGPGYAPSMRKGNRHDPVFAAAFDAGVATTQTEFGFQGFWIDSFQNLLMSQLAWSDGSGAPMQRAWWEWLAAWSRRGVATMAESHAVPGISCSIEVPDWQQDLWYFRQVWKWYRGDAMRTVPPAERRDRLFRVMAQRGWTAPDQAYRLDPDLGIPDFGLFARAYLAVLPDMQRSYILPGGSGMLWLGLTDDRAGVLFAFQEQELPAGVSAEPVGPHATAAVLQSHQVYRLQATDLLAAFAIRRPPQPDERLGRVVALPSYAWPTAAAGGHSAD